MKTGLRERESTHLLWTDIDFTRKVVIVRAKKPVEVESKGKKEIKRVRSKSRKYREIPLEEKLLGKLVVWKKANPGRKLVFGRGNFDSPDNHLLVVCKATAYRAGLNCGSCDSCLTSDNTRCAKWYLHGFRSTFATRSLQAGVDIRTVSAWLGHADIQMTVKYLKPAEGEQAQNLINGVFEDD